MKTYLAYGAGTTVACAVLTLVLHILGYLNDPEKLGTGMMISIPTVILIVIVGLVLEAASLYHMTGFTLGIPFEHAAWARVFQTVGLAFL